MAAAEDSATKLWSNGGHWIWNRDLGFSEFLTATGASGVLDKLSGTPDHTFIMEPTGTLKITVISNFTPSDGILFEYKGVTSSEGHYGRHTGKDQETEVEGIMVKKVYIKDGTLFDIEELSSLGKLQTRTTIRRWVSDEGEYHMAISNTKCELTGTRIFSRFPYYVVVNNTGKTVTMRTYSMSDFVYLASAMTKEVLPGKQLVDASGGKVTEEQVTFSLEDGRQYTVSGGMKAFGEVELTDGIFA